MSAINSSEDQSSATKRIWVALKYVILAFVRPGSNSRFIGKLMDSDDGVRTFLWLRTHFYFKDCSILPELEARRDKVVSNLLKTLTRDSREEQLLALRYLEALRADYWKDIISMKLSQGVVLALGYQGDRGIEFILTNRPEAIAFCSVDLIDTISTKGTKLTMPFFEQIINDPRVASDVKIRVGKVLGEKGHQAVKFVPAIIRLAPLCNPDQITVLALSIAQILYKNPDAAKLLDEYVGLEIAQTALIQNAKRFLESETLVLGAT